MSEMKTKNGLSYGLILLAMAAGIVLGLAMAQSRMQRRYANANALNYKVEETMNLLQSQYVDEVDGDSLTDKMLNAMLSTLDPHSRYLSIDEMNREATQIQGHFDGIGVVLRRVGDTSCVGQVFADGPAAAAGLQPGDRIVTIDTVQAAKRKVSADGVVKLIRGRRHTTVDLGILRRGVEGLTHYKVRRDVVLTPTVAYHTMLDSKNGYIRISSFAENTHEEFCNALKDLQSKKMQRLIVDLRGNGGGLLEASLDIANELLPKGDMIVYTQGRHQRRKEVKSTGNGLYTKGSLIVMIDENSASASEVLAGAIQDNDRGTIMGRRSFGKGLVQGQFELADGSAIWLTTARYYTPSGRCIQKSYKDGYEQYYLDNYKQAMEESFSDTLDARTTDSTKYYTKGKRVVYGGGGIVPDKVIPMKRYNDILYYNELSNAMVYFDYSFNYVTSHISQLKKTYTSADQFEKRFAVTDQMVEQMVAIGEKKGIARNANGLNKYKYLMKSTVKAYIGQCLFGDDLYYRLVLAQDDELKQAVNYK